MLPSTADAGQLKMMMTCTYKQQKLNYKLHLNIKISDSSTVIFMWKEQKIKLLYAERLFPEILVHLPI